MKVSRRRYRRPVESPVLARLTPQRNPSGNGRLAGEVLPEWSGNTGEHASLAGPGQAQRRTHVS